MYVFMLQYTHLHLQRGPGKTNKSKFPKELMLGLHLCLWLPEPGWSEGFSCPQTQVLLALRALKASSPTFEFPPSAAKVLGPGRSAPCHLISHSLSQGHSPQKEEQTQAEPGTAVLAIPES